MLVIRVGGGSLWGALPQVFPSTFMSNHCLLPLVALPSAWTAVPCVLLACVVTISVSHQIQNGLAPPFDRFRRSWYDPISCGKMKELASSESHVCACHLCAWQLRGQSHLISLRLFGHVIDGENESRNTMRRLPAKELRWNQDELSCFGGI